MTSRLVVVGDALLDVDVEGRAGRLTPDAPVPVLDDVREAPRPGGAALAAALAAGDGAEVTLVTPLADDDAGRTLRSCLGPVVQVVAMPTTGSTVVKRRIRAGGQSLARLDTGDGRADVTELSAELPPAVDDALRDADAVLVSDYGRGTTACPALRRRLEALTRSVPVVWDPHPRGERPVRGALLVTPNAAEAAEMSAREGLATDTARASMAAHGAQAAHLVGAWQARAVAVTAGPRGALLSYGQGTPMVLPAPPVGGRDCCGAGDRFAAAAALMFLRGAVISEAVHAAVDSASAFVAGGGAAALTFPMGGRPGPADSDADSRSDATSVVERVRAGKGTVVATGGCFDLLHAGHVATLRAARRLGECLVVCLNSDASVARLKGPARPLVPAEDRSRVLMALEFVDAVVVFDEDTPEQVIRRLRPDIWAKGGDYAADDLPEATVLQEWGGQAVVLPYLAGRSTTSLVESAVTGTVKAAPRERVGTHPTT